MKLIKGSLKPGRDRSDGEQKVSPIQSAVVSNHPNPVPAHGSLSHLEAFFNTPSIIFPSLETKSKLSVAKRAEADAAKILTSISLAPLVKEGSDVPPQSFLAKRPVGRPRLHPKKELDPNRVRRVARGDKPLGRPRTSHLKPPVVKRPRGRPRKDASNEIFAAPLDEQAKKALTEEWRNTMSNAGDTVVSSLSNAK